MTRYVRLQPSNRVLHIKVGMQDVRLDSRSGSNGVIDLATYGDLEQVSNAAQPAIKQGWLTAATVDDSPEPRPTQQPQVLDVPIGSLAKAVKPAEVATPPATGLNPIAAVQQAAPSMVEAPTSSKPEIVDDVIEDAVKAQESASTQPPKRKSYYKPKGKTTKAQAEPVAEVEPVREPVKVDSALELVPELTSVRIAELKKLGIGSCEQLAAISAEELAKKIGVPSRVTAKWIEAAKQVGKE